MCPFPLSAFSTGAPSEASGPSGKGGMVSLKPSGSLWGPALLEAPLYLALAGWSRGPSFLPHTHTYSVGQASKKSPPATFNTTRLYCTKSLQGRRPKSRAAELGPRGRMWAHQRDPHPEGGKPLLCTFRIRTWLASALERREEESRTEPPGQLSVCASYQLSAGWTRV